MGRKKNNQAKHKFSYKNDTPELVEVAQFLREAFPGILVKVEWAILYNDSGFKGYAKNVNIDCPYRFKTPDIMLIDKKNRNLIGCIEIDGNVHDVHLDETWQRNELYEEIGVPLEVVTKTTMNLSIFDEAYKCAEKLCKVD
ncbi:MAG: hypothetical protein GWN01_07005 [Nitrosopumilaceae archaeon]|nr:hypothetical protein [Nitrosopumilaceae archaeon]NIU86134.1 hypothetical protein [Nitrosopumilaceae archaeon]NIX61282.1 hypothetical protein [Nitrosopumilaceae archaeon]